MNENSISFSLQVLHIMLPGTTFFQTKTNLFKFLRSMINDIGANIIEWKNPSLTIITRKGSLSSQGKREERLRELATYKEKYKGMKWEVIDNRVF